MGTTKNYRPGYFKGGNCMVCGLYLNLKKGKEKCLSRSQHKVLQTKIQAKSACSHLPGAPTQRPLSLRTGPVRWPAGSSRGANAGAGKLGVGTSPSYDLYHFLRNAQRYFFYYPQVSPYKNSTNASVFYLLGFLHSISLMSWEKRWR